MEKQKQKRKADHTPQKSGPKRSRTIERPSVLKEGNLVETWQRRPIKPLNPKKNCIATCCQSYIALCQLASNPGNSELNAITYMKAGGEGVFVVLATCWAITYFFDPNVIEENPLKDRLGYNNPCIGMDTKPAIYFASAMLTFPIYLNFRAAWVAAMTEVYNHKKAMTIWKIFSFASCIVYMLSTAILAVLFLVTPGTPEETFWHTAIYAQYIIGRLFFVWMQYCRNGYKEDVDLYDQKKAKYFFRVYIAVSLLAPALFSINFAWYDNYRDDGDGPLIPWYVTATVDYTWFICMGLTSTFMPKTEDFVLGMERMDQLRKQFHEAH